MLWSLVNKIVGHRPATLFKRAPAQVLSWEFCDIFMKTLFYITSLVAASDYHKTRAFLNNYNFISSDISLLADHKWVIQSDLQTSIELINAHQFQIGTH